MLGPLLFDNKGAIVKMFVLQKKILTVKENIKKKAFFAKKNLLLNMNLKNVVKQKRCTRVILLGAKKISTRKKSKLKVWHSFKKKTLNHTSGTQKRFFSISYFEKCFCVQSLPTANCSLV